MTVRRRFIGGFLLALLAGCAAQPAPRETFHRLQPAALTTRFATPPLAGAIEVDRVAAEGVLSERAIAFQTAGGALQRYTYELWVDPPGTMVQEALVRALKAANVAASVVTPDLRVVPAWIMRAKLHRFEQIPTAGRVSMALSVAVLSADDSRLLLQKDYEAEAPTGGEGAAGVAAAMDKAAAEVLARLVDDLGHAAH